MTERRRFESPHPSTDNPTWQFPTPLYFFQTLQSWRDHMKYTINKKTSSGGKVISSCLEDYNTKLHKNTRLGIY